MDTGFMLGDILINHDQTFVVLIKFEVVFVLDFFQTALGGLWHMLDWPWLLVDYFFKRKWPLNS